MNIQEHEILGNKNRKEFKDHYGREARHRGELALFWVLQNSRSLDDEKIEDKSGSNDINVSGSQSEIDNCSIDSLRRKIAKIDRSRKTT